ncbi:MAG: hypothetical protein COB49_11880 [Alphaproteobacteria bacterium]|nr:MAG: hypothetical protein COB49_11880 [Alphaproteobacteria bacterium]
MVDIASTSSTSSQVQVDRSSSQENTAALKEVLSKAAEDSAVERKEVESATGPDVGRTVDIRA